MSLSLNYRQPCALALPSTRLPLSELEIRYSGYGQAEGGRLRHKRCGCGFSAACTRCGPSWPPSTAPRKLLAPANGEPGKLSLPLRAGEWQRCHAGRRRRRRRAVILSAPGIAALSFDHELVVSSICAPPASSEKGGARQSALDLSVQAPPAALAQPGERPRCWGYRDRHSSGPGAARGEDWTRGAAARSAWPPATPPAAAAGHAEGPTIAAMMPPAR